MKKRKPQEDKPELTYEQTVHNWLYSAKEGKYVVAKFCKPENVAKFIEAIKSYIDDGIKNGYCIEFNTKMTKFRKYDTAFD